MKNCLLFTLLFLAAGLMAQGADSLSFALPQNMDPVFDYFSLNHLSTASLGRGTTGVSCQGGASSILANPASYLMDRSSVYAEMLIKPPVETHIYPSDHNFNSPVPFGMVAAAGNLSDDLSWGIAYSMPKSMVWDAFVVNMNMGDFQLVRYPKYYQHQFTANIGVHIGELNLGLNLHNQLHYIDDFTVLRSFEQIREVKYQMRPQFGALWAANRFNAGISYTPRMHLDWDLKYAHYDLSMPGTLSAGLSLREGIRRYVVEADWEDSSVLNDQYKDRLSLKAGYEATSRKYTYRLGYLYRPQIFSGNFKLPMNTTAHPDTSMWWDSVARGGRIPKNDQHLITAGFTWPFSYGAINLGMLMEVAGPTKMAQIGGSLELNLDYFRRKKSQKQ